MTVFFGLFSGNKAVMMKQTRTNSSEITEILITVGVS